MSNTVKDLIEQLKLIPEDLPVELEGCDCIGYWKGELEIETNDGDTTVILRRGPGGIR